MGSLINITIAAFPKIHLKVASPGDQDETVNSINVSFGKHKLADRMRIERIDGAAFPDVNSMIREKYNSSNDFFLVQATDHHSFVVCINSVDVIHLENGIKSVWVELNGHFEKVVLQQRMAEWAFTCSVVEKKKFTNGDTTEVLSKLVLSKDDFDGSLVNNVFEGWWDWNAGLILLNKPVHLQKILYCFIIQSAKWAITERSTREAIDLMGKLLDRTDKEVLDNEQKLLDLYQMHIYFNTITEKSFISYDQEDRSLHDLIEKGWGYDGVRQQVTALFVDIDKLVSFSNGIALKKSSHKTNKFLTYIGIIGFSGTVAGLISTIDFSNAFLSTEVARLILISLLTLLLVVFFFMLNMVAKPLKERKKSALLADVPVGTNQPSRNVISRSQE